MRFTSLLALSSFVSLAVALAHCGDDDASPAGPTSSEGGTGSSGATSSGSTSGAASSSGSTSGSLPNWPPPSRPACATPTIDAPTVLVQADGGVPNNSGGVTLAWSGKQAALVYFQGRDGP